MDAEFSCKEETDEIISCAFAVLNEGGHGYHEKPYKNGLVVEFRYRNIPFEQQPSYPILYRGVKICDFIPDLVVFGKVIVDTKVIDHITDQEIGQMINYLKVTRLPVGLLLNFKHTKLEIRCVVLSTQPFIKRPNQP